MAKDDGLIIEGEAGGEGSVALTPTDRVEGPGPDLVGACRELLLGGGGHPGLVSVLARTSPGDRLRRVVEYQCGSCGSTDVEEVLIGGYEYDEAVCREVARAAEAGEEPNLDAGQRARAHEIHEASQTFYARAVAGAG